MASDWPRGHLLNHPMMLPHPGSLECGQNAREKDVHLNGPSQSKYVDLTKVGFLAHWPVGLKCFSAPSANPWVSPGEKQLSPSP